MSAERPQTPTHVMPITSIDDPRTISLLTTEHWSLLSARSLAYNEAFVRAGMFLTFLSMSFGESFLSVAALVLAFDFVVGVTTLLRMNGANLDDLRALHGMARIRHAYTQITPLVAPYFTTAAHDDIDAVLTAYGPLPERLSGQFLYGLSTSNGMIALIVSMVGGVLTTVVAMIIGLEAVSPIWAGVAGGIIVLAALFAFTGLAILRVQRRFTVLFPTPGAEPVVEREA